MKITTPFAKDLIMEAFNDYEDPNPFYTLKVRKKEIFKDLGDVEFNQRTLNNALMQDFINQEILLQKDRLIYDKDIINKYNITVSKETENSFRLTGRHDKSFVVFAILSKDLKRIIFRYNSELSPPLSVKEIISDYIEMLDCH